MDAVTLLAHGGAVGAAVEIAFILVPVIVFIILARISKKRMEREEAEEEDGA
jgi:large-conductance mechanosensitive channel